MRVEQTEDKIITENENFIVTQTKDKITIEQNEEKTLIPKCSYSAEAIIKRSE